VRNGWDCNYNIICIIASQEAGSFPENTWHGSPNFGGGSAYRIQAGELPSGSPLFNYNNFMGAYNTFERARGGIASETITFRHIGVHAHEVFHTLGLVFLGIWQDQTGVNFTHYATGDWSAMHRTDVGPKRKGECESHLSAARKVSVGWARATDVTANAMVESIQYINTQTDTASTATDFYRFTDPVSGEQFVIENRQYSGFNRFLPGWWDPNVVKGGLLISNIKPYSHLGCNDRSVERLRLADNNLTTSYTVGSSDPARIWSVGDPGDPFPGTSNNTNFSIATTPNSARRDPTPIDCSTPTATMIGGDPTGFAITNISPSAATMTATFHKSYLASNSADATAFNNSRKLVRDCGGAYHLVYESSGEVYYQKSTDGGSMWSGDKRLSSGNGSNKYPCLAERSGSLFVVWQRYTGSTHVVYHRRYASGAWGSTQTLDSNAGANAPLPVIASPAANELMVVYRSGGNLKWRRSTDNGSSWSTAATISGTALNSPTVAPAKTPWGENTTALAYATNVIPNASNILLHYYYNGWSSAWNLSSGLPGNLSQHANPSVAASGDLSYWHPHTAWDAYDSQYYGRVILHKVGWNASSYYEFHYQTEDRPSITGLAGATAEMIFRRGEDRFFTGHYNGSYWDVPLATQPGKHPSFSLGSTQAKYVFMSGSAAPFEVKVSSATFSKANLLAEHVKQRAVGLVDPVSGAWLNMRVESFLVKHADGSFSAADFAPAPADTARLTASEAWAALASAEFILPAEAESLLVVYSIAGEKAKSLSDGKAPLALTFKVETIGEAALTKTSQILALSSDEAFNQAGVLLGVSSEGLRKDAKVILRVYPSHQKSDTEVVASLGHVYDLSKGAESASLKPLAARTAQVPASLVLEQNFPNPFNPTTEIRYTLPAAGAVRLALYDLTGRLVMILFEGEQRAGRHTIRWHGQDRHGRPVGAGVYFCRLETPGAVQTRKLVLAK